MTKNKFLKDLDKSLYVLAEAERKDIINEYRDIIEEKIKHGKTEKEAVDEFGSIEELSREILSAYKVNPDYSKKDEDFVDSAKKLGNDFDSFVKKGAKKATEFTKEVVEEIKQSNNEITIEFVFELLFKGVATLIIMFIASIPFMIVKQIGESILNVVVYPLNKLLILIWILLLTILFIGCCGLIFIAMFKQYFSRKNADIKEVKNTAKVKSEMKKDDKITEKGEVEKSINKAPKKVKKQKNGTPLLDIFLAIAKAILVILMLPLVFFNIAVVVGIAITIYLMIKGLVIPGFLIILIGILIFFGNLQLILFNTIFKQKKIYFSPFIVAIVIGIVGGIMCFDQMITMNYYDYAPKVDFKKETYTEIIDAKSNNIHIWDHIYNSYNTIEYKTDLTLPDNKIKFEITNYPELTNIRIEDSGNIKEYDGTNSHYIYLYQNNVNLLAEGHKKLNKEFIENFNDKKIYNYDKLYQSKIIIYTNGKLNII